jgi:hypothetical protein
MKAHDLKEDLRTKADYMQSRATILKKLRDYYIANLAEDCTTGTDFDCDVIMVIQALKDKHCPLKRPRGV